MWHAFTALPMMEASMAQDREMVEPHEGDKRYVRRDEEGKFKEQDDVGRSLSQDQKRDSQQESKSGQGDRGDRSGSSGGSGTGGSSSNR
jgi:hypothetical protein